jgi:DNA-binding transcriptional MerR regulator
LLTIQEVARRTGLSPSTIRYYDQQFEEYLGIRRGGGRRRLFSPEAVERLLRVRDLLKDQGLSLRQARQALGDPHRPLPGAAATGPARDQDLAELRAEVDGLKAEVAALERRLRELKEIQERTLTLVASLTR